MTGRAAQSPARLTSHVSSSSDRSREKADTLLRCGLGFGCLAGCDGPWPKTSSLSAWEADPEVEKAVRSVAATFRAPFVVRDCRQDKSGKAVLIDLQLRTGKPTDGLRHALKADAVMLLKAVFDTSEQVTEVRMRWWTNWRNRLGQTRLRTLVEASMARELFGKIVCRPML